MAEAPRDFVLSPAVFRPGQLEPVGAFQVTDDLADARHGFTLAQGEGDTDNGKFAISGTSLRPWLFDFSSVPAGTVFSLRVRASDLGRPERWVERVFLVSTAVPRPPARILVDATSVSSGAVEGALVARLVVEDPDPGEVHLLELVAGTGDADNDKARITGSELRLLRPPTPGQERFRVRVRATDGAGLFREEVLDLPFEEPAFRINEILAGELGGILDRNRGRKEWIELYNPRSQYEALEGWHLTDDRRDLTRWRFPRIDLSPGGFLLILADGLGVPPAGSTNLHASFSLDAGGEWVGLVAPDGQRLASELSFPAQFPGVSYGIGAGGTVGHLPQPTPGAMNGVVAATGENQVHFSRSRGFCRGAFDLFLEASVPGSVIRYTLDGTSPTPTTGLVYGGAIRVTPSTAATVRGTRVVRALAVQPDAAYAPVATHTYLFIEGIEGPWVDGVPGQSRLAGAITRDPVYGPLMGPALRALPAVALTLAGAGPSTTERMASLELFDPEEREAGFQVDCGIAATGTTSLGSPKLSMAARFRSAYGTARLRYPVFARGSAFPGRAAETFHELRLRSHSHDTFYWLGTRENPPVPYGSPAVTRSGDAQLVRNPWIDEMQLAMGQPGKHGRQVHLYLNGAYHGIYHLHEHADEDFMASYYPGRREDFHFVGGGTTGSDHGGGDTWRVPWGLLKASLGSPAQASRWIDLTNLCDYLVLSFYAGNDWDWSAQHNWSAAGPRSPDRGGWKFFQQDSDVTLQDVGADNTDQNVPDGVFNALMRFPDFRVLFRDRVYRHCFGDGVLTASRAGASYHARMEEISTAIVAETARWQPSSSVGLLPWDRDEEWRKEWRYLSDTFFPQRTGRLLDQLRRRAGWWPVEPPTPRFAGGVVPVGVRQTYTTPSGTVYLTTDGSDPRLPGGGIHPSARPVGVASASQVVIPPGSVWRFLDDGTDPGDGWTLPGFGDGLWKAGPTEIGYGDGGEATVSGFVDADPTLAGVQKNLTTYFRRRFDVADPDGWTGLALRLVRDDGAVVFLNGHELWRVGMPEGPIRSTTPADVGIGGVDESTFLEQSVAIPPGLLRASGNVLAVEIHQQSPGSSDISFNLEAAVTGPPREDEGGVLVDRPMVIRARVFAGGDWSALVESFLRPLGTAQASAANLVLTEIQYHPLDLPEAEFLEFWNDSPVAMDLSGVVITNAVYYRFPEATVLQADERVVVVRDVGVFHARHQAPDSAYQRPSLRVLGPWAGSLSNGGERIDVLDVAGMPLLGVEYGTAAPWPGRADGRGSSLELAAAAPIPGTPDERAAWQADAAHWRASLDFHGSPGSAGTAAAGRVVLNEVLAGSGPLETDAIELFNRSESLVNVSGWYLSDASSEYRKFRLPPALLLSPGAHVLFREEDFNRPGAERNPVPFSLNAQGDEVFLVEADAEGHLLRFADVLEFSAMPEGVSLGRVPDGGDRWAWLHERSLGRANGSAPSGYQAWASTRFPGGSDPASVLPEADPDGDGLPNLAEYAFGLPPLRAEGRALWADPGGEREARGFVHRVGPGVEGVRLEVEVSTDLRTWALAGAGVHEVSRRILADGAVEITEAIRGWSEAPGLFVRIRVSRQP